MARIRKAYSEDFALVMPLLARFNNPNISEDNWMGLFRDKWQSSEDYYGLILEDEGEAKGFLGTIFSHRNIDGKIYKFCNLSAWIVDEKYRGKSLILLSEAMKLNDYTITDLTASEKVSKIIEKFGFIPFEDSVRILLPMNLLKAASGKYKLEFDFDEICSRINENEKQILNDHKQLNVGFVLVEKGSDHSLIIYKKIRKKGIPFVNLHYIGNNALFADSKDLLTFKLCKKEKCPAIMFDSRLAGGRNIGIKRMLSSPRYFLSKELGAGNIDTLYSELLILDA